MLFNKKMIQCQTKQNKEATTHHIEYHKAIAHVQNVRYQIIKSLMADQDIIVDIDTSLFSPAMRLNPTEYIGALQQKLKAYGIQYKMSRAKKEVLDAGIGRVFSVKPSKISTAYRVSFYMPSISLNYACYQDLLENIGHRICIVKSGSDVDQLLELFYSGMIDDMDFAELFYAHFYCNEQLNQLLVVTRAITKDQINTLLEEIIKR